MPLLDITTAQAALQNQLAPLRAQTLVHGKTFSSSFPAKNEKRLVSSWTSFHVPKRVNLNNGGHLETRGGKLLIKAVATLEPKCFVRNEDGERGCENAHLALGSSSLAIQVESPSGEDTMKLDKRERLRRLRISRANKGLTPWNKGRKHSPETIERIKEKTKIAMQDPKIKMKLVKLGHAQSKETRMKIGVTLRMRWQEFHKKLMLQETCYFEWQNLIAEASRSGFVGDDELEWDSYHILAEQLKQEWLSTRQKNATHMVENHRRRPKSPEQRRKIAESISAKWGDPAYRQRVCSGIAKYHGTPVRTESKPRKKPKESPQPRKNREGTETRSQRSVKKNTGDNTKNSSERGTKSQVRQPRTRRSNKPLYKDPLISSKLKMIKNIKAQRAAAEAKKTEAIERARLLIAEAENAAKALEAVAMKSPIALASLMESRKLIAEAIQSIESIGTGKISSSQNDRRPPFTPPEPVITAQKEIDARNGVLNEAEQKQVNGTKTVLSSRHEDFKFSNFSLQDMLHVKEDPLSTSSSLYGLPVFNMEHVMKQLSPENQLSRAEPNGSSTKHRDKWEPNGKAEWQKNPLSNGSKLEFRKEDPPPKPTTVTKKWVRGKLVEVTEETQV